MFNLGFHGESQEAWLQVPVSKILPRDIFNVCSPCRLHKPFPMGIQQGDSSTTEHLGVMFASAIVYEFDGDDLFLSPTLFTIQIVRQIVGRSNFGHG